MSFIKDNAIIAQNAGTSAAAIVSAMVESGAYGLDTMGDVMEAFNAIRTDIFQGSLELAGVSDPSEVPADAPRRSGGGGGRRSSGGGSNGKTPETYSLTFGKYNGRTIADIHEDDPEYVEWLADKANEAFVKKLARQALEAA